VTGVDLDAHADPQRRLAGIAGVDAHTHGDALDDFDPVAARVLRRQQLEFLCSGWADALDGTVPLDVWISIDGHRHRLAWPHIGHLRFFGIDLNPSVISGNKEEGSH
jgi:hypothetical protein